VILRGNFILRFSYSAQAHDAVEAARFRGRFLPLEGFTVYLRKERAVWGVMPPGEIVGELDLVFAEGRSLSGQGQGHPVDEVSMQGHLYRQVVGGMTMGLPVKKRAGFESPPESEE